MMKRRTYEMAALSIIGAGCGYRHLTSVKDQIVHGTFSVDDFRRIDDQFREQKEALAKQLLSPVS